MQVTYKLYMLEEGMMLLQGVSMKTGYMEAQGMMKLRGEGGAVTISS